MEEIQEWKERNRKNDRYMFVGEVKGVKWNTNGTLPPPLLKVVLPSNQRTAHSFDGHMMVCSCRHHSTDWSEGLKGQTHQRE